MIGRELDARFTLSERLGQGGMGAVYRATQHSVAREVAVKVVHPNLMTDATIIKRFHREARLASRLNHPNAVSVMDFGQTQDGVNYLVMELLEGTTLDAVLERDGRFDARRIIRIGIQICDALEAAHALSIIHRDLKPSNIMLLDSVRDFVKVLDFGLAKSLESDAASQMTGSGHIVGTPAYMPPERACGATGDARSDLYSLGCILFLLGSGALPFDATGAQELLLQQVVQRPPPMTGVPDALAQVIERLLEKEPDLRYQTAAEAREGLEAALATLPSRAATAPVVAVAAVGTHTTLLSPPPLARTTRPRAKSTAVHELERSDTVSASAIALPVRRRWGWIGAAALCSLLVVVLAIVFARRSPPIATAAEVIEAPSSPAVATEPAAVVIAPAEVPASIEAPAPPPRVKPAKPAAKKRAVAAPVPGTAAPF